MFRAHRNEGRGAPTIDLAKRSAFQRFLSDGEAGLLDVVMDHKLDRFARNIRITLKRLEKSGVGFVSISEQMEFMTPIG